jgi:hypothetical protein
MGSHPGPAGPGSSTNGKIGEIDLICGYVLLSETSRYGRILADRYREGAKPIFDRNRPFLKFHMQKSREIGKYSTGPFSRILF